MSLPRAFFAKTSRLFEITKVPCFIGFPSTGLVWGESRGLCNEEARRFAKPLDLLGRNAKTRWREPAGLERNGHVAVTTLMEAAGIEPASRDASDPASTCLANYYFLALRVRR